MTADTLQATPSPYDFVLGSPARRAAQAGRGPDGRGRRHDRHRSSRSASHGGRSTTGPRSGWPWRRCRSRSASRAGTRARSPLLLGAGSDVVGVAITTTFTLLLITRRMTFEESLLGVLGGQALIGCWLVLAGIAAASAPGSRSVAAFGVLGGAGLATVAAVVATSGMTNPLSFVGFAAGIIGTFGFYARLGRRARG